MTPRITDHPPILLLQGLVFSLVAAAFTTIYMTQPVLPIIQAEFGVDETVASLTVSGVILGIAMSNLPFGALADAFPIRPIILVGGTVISLSSLICFGTRELYPLIAARCVQGVFIPAITTCLAAYLSSTLPRENLNTVMGAYIAATVAGGLGGRLIGGWVHSPSEWRLGFLSSGALVAAATLAAVLILPDEKPIRVTGKRPAARVSALVRQGRIWGCLAVSFSAFYVFSSVFNYLPFYLSAPLLRVNPSDHPHVLELRLRHGGGAPGRADVQPVWKRAHHDCRCRCIRPLHCGNFRSKPSRDRCEPCRGLHRVFHGPYRRHRGPQPAAGSQQRHGQLPLCSELLHGGRCRRHLQRVGLPGIPVAGGGRWRLHHPGDSYRGRHRTSQGAKEIRHLPQDTAKGRDVLSQEPSEREDTA